MLKMISGILLGILILCSGCIRSLHPVYTEQDLIFESSLIGQWSEDFSKETWEFTQKKTNSYRLVYTDDKGKKGTFSAHLLKIEGSLFLDFFPVEPEMNENDFYKAHLLPVHTFAYVKQIEPTLQMSFPEPDWLKKLIAYNPEAVRHEKIDDEIILTAGTKELQALLIKNINTEGVFEDTSNMKRRTSVISEEQPNKPAEGDGLKPTP